MRDRFNIMRRNIIRANIAKIFSTSVVGANRHAVLHSKNIMTTHSSVISYRNRRTKTVKINYSIISDT